MKIAVASQNFRTVTGHAGKTRRFLIFAAQAGAPPAEIDRISLPAELAMHNFRGDGPHPLDAVDVVIAGSMGPGFVARMAARGVTAVATTETDPAAAAAAYVAERLPPALPDDGHHRRHHRH